MLELEKLEFDQELEMTEKNKLEQIQMKEKLDKCEVY